MPFHLRTIFLPRTSMHNIRCGGFSLDVCVYALAPMYDTDCTRNMQCWPILQ